MAYNSGFNPKHIDNFTKITNLKNIKKETKYLVRYSTLGKPRLYHIAKCKDIKTGNGEKVYWFDSIYVRRPSERHWRLQEDERPHIAFDNGELYIDEGLINTDYEPLSIMDEGFDFAIFELGVYGNRISDTVAPEDILSIITKYKHSTKMRTPASSSKRTHGGMKRRKSIKSKMST